MRAIMIISLLFTMSVAENTMVKDIKNGLMWEDTPHVQETKITQPRAMKYCSKLKIGEFNDWRLPTIQELLTIVDYKRINPALIKEFSYIEKESYYWSNTLVADADDEFWGVNFKRGASSKASEYYDRYARCVRNLIE